MKKLVLSIAAATLLPALPVSAQTAPATAAATTSVVGAAKKAATTAATNAARRAAARAVAPVVNKVTGAANTATAATPAATTPAAPAATVPAATVPAASATATSPVVAAAKALFNVDETSIGTLLDNPATKAVLSKYIPAMISNPQIDMARGMTLTQVQGFAGDLLNNETLAKIAADLAGIK